MVRIRVRGRVRVKKRIRDRGRDRVRVRVRVRRGWEHTCRACQAVASRTRLPSHLSERGSTQPVPLAALNAAAPASRPAQTDLQGERQHRGCQ